VNPTIALWSAIALASTPVVFIHSTNAMDYTWAMSFLLLAFLSLLHNRMLLCGLCIGLATGCRITSAAMVLPFALYVYQTLPAQQKIKSITGLIGYTCIFSLLVFLPVIQHYGLGFFTYYEHFPIPHWTKNLYKGSLGVWGLPALLLMGWFFFTSLKNIRARYTGLEYRQQALVMLCLLSVILIGIAFIRLPLKSAFLIPAVPFFLILFGFLVSRKQFRTLSLALLLGCFMLGVNLAEAHRGSDTSKLAIRFQIANHQIAFDPLIGLVTADRSKRLQRTAYAQQVIRTCSTIEQRSAILCGWWLADILVLAANEKNNPAITYLHYISPQQADSLSQSGYTIYFLEEQEYYNDLRFDSVFTKSVCLPISIQD
jgi:4-amino-4-deoxy-L-arabinose transferase-like glycosyltransferase